MNETQQNNKLVVVTIISLIVGFGFGWITFGGAPTATPLDDEMATSTAKNTSGVVKADSDAMKSVAPQTKTETAPPSQIAIKVSDQPAGMSVMVDSVSLKNESWIAVHEDRNGLPGNILGARRLAVGTHENVVVELLRETVTGGKNYITIFTDDGDKSFDNKKDLLLVDSEGDVIMSSFITTSPVIIDTSMEAGDASMIEGIQIEAVGVETEPTTGTTTDSN